MAPQAQPALQNATKTINDFFQYHKPPPDIRNAWTFLKTHLHPSNTPPPQPLSLAPLSEALEKIQDRHTLIEKRVSAPQSAAKPRVVNWSGYYPTRTGPDRTGSGFGPQTQIPGPGICFPPSTRTEPNVPRLDRMHLYLGSVSQNI